MMSYFSSMYHIHMLSFQHTPLLLRDNNRLMIPKKITELLVDELDFIEEIADIEIPINELYNHDSICEMMIKYYSADNWYPDVKAINNRPDKQIPPNSHLYELNQK